MPQVINTNSMSLMARNNLNKSQGALNTAIQRLSSGLRVNSAKDDAAGQAIANRFTANINGLTQASRNASDGISISQIGEGALNEINTNVQRIRELAVRAANGTNSDKDVASIQKEIDQRIEEINRIADQTDYNGTKLFADRGADDKGLIIQVGANDNETITIKLKKFGTDDMGLTTNGKFDIVKTDGTTSKQLETVDKALAEIDDLRSEFGATQSRFESAISNINNSVLNLTAGRSRIVDADFSEEVSNMTLQQILQQSGTAVLAQANQVPQLVLSLLR